jgi:hypothetical protein
LGKSRWEQSDGTGLKRARQQGTGGFLASEKQEGAGEKTARGPLHQLHCPNGEFIHIDALYETDI